MELKVQIDSEANIFVNANLTAITYSAVELVCSFINLEAKWNEQLNTRLYKPVGGVSKVLPVLAYDNFDELNNVVTYTSGATLVFTVVPECNFLASATHFYAWNQTTGTELPVSRALHVSSGQTIYDLFAGESVLANGFSLGATDVNSSFSVFHSADKSKKYYSGGINYDKLFAPVITVTIDTSTGVSNGNVVELRINHTTMLMLSIDASNGSITTVSQN